MESRIVEFVFRAALIAVATAVVLWTLRIKTAPARHAAWVGVLIAMLALPVWMAWGPKASLPVLPADGEPAAVMNAAPLAFAAAPPVSTPLQNPNGESPGQDWHAIWIGLYLLGAVALLLRLALGTILANRLTSASCVVPVTVGLFNPRIILPECWTEWPQAQRDAVMTHEREHVRRRDPLVHWLALFNRAVFWFHPLAWWLERRLSALAEEACDAAVLAQGYDAAEYSGYLLDLARSVEQAGKRINVVAMAMPGSALPRRIRNLASGIRPSRISRVRLTFAALACVIPAVVFAAGTLDHAPQILPLRPLPAWILPQPPVLLASSGPVVHVASARSAAAKIEFEAASVQSSGPFSGNPGENSGLIPASGDIRGGPGTSDPEQITFSRVPLRRILVTAFDVLFDQISGPQWVVTGDGAVAERYDIVAKIQPGATKTQVNEMLRNLLVKRFALSAHIEKRPFDVYTLTVAKGGPKLKPAAAADGPAPPTPTLGTPARQPTLDQDGYPILPAGYRNMVGRGDADGHIRLTARMMAPGRLLGMIQFGLGTPHLFDKTGLTGPYDFRLEYSSAGLPGRAAISGVRNLDEPLPDLFTALEQQLGLKLEKSTVPLDLVVIDHIDKVPNEN